MKKLLLAATVLALFAAGCYKYDPQFEGPYEEGDEPATPVNSYEILTVENGDIFLYNKLLDSRKGIANLPPGIEKASINYAHDRIAYQVPGSDIVIVDTLGTTLGKVNNSASAQWFDWHNNDRSLYVLAGFQLTVWGDALTTPATNLTSVFPLGSSDREMNAVAVMADGSIVVPCSYFAGFSTGYVSKIVVLPASGARWELPISYYGHTYWMRADRTGQHIYYGLFAGGDQEVWGLNVDERYNVYNYDRQFQAPSPQNDRLAYCEGGQLNAVNLVTGYSYTTGFSSGNVTALDW